MALLSYKNLMVWQKSMDLVLAIYDLTRNFPKEEVYGLSSQMRRSVVSIPSNIAEGNRRGTRKDYRHFVVTAFASGAELETQVELSKRLGFVQDSSRVDELLDGVMRMLNRLSQQLF
ncbi:MAG: four helix bundle protein [bacterium]|nr:four helix bundle protein [bacterium]